ncbi:hypothetical protein [Corynebacterium aquatimens]|uniref:SCP domain-containing protein n=1 Tax=Corynebacterium aquatimens TaxID=1190508 RepID=A0A931E2F8_9CORY|nr:hypothetical protein [Corynebacterium aquatimens]MBG6122350.1 hypothetical protein [Corynebacterium aquatimens]WJY65107.1 hypothetical protein CAQUA_01870 [Corynebacterium aquatimens]
MRTRLFAAAVAAATALTLSPAVASAAPAPVTDVEINVPVSNSVAFDVTFDGGAAQNVGLPELRKLRGQMWDLNPYFTLGTSNPEGYHLRDVAESFGLTTKEAYANAAHLDHGLTRIAVQRAAEHGAVSIQPHVRPDGTSAFTATYRNSSASGGESLASGRNLKDSVSKGWGHGELLALNASRGVWNYSNGHLHQMLNPSNRYYGFGEVYVPWTVHRVHTSAQASKTPLGGQPLAEGTQRTWLYRAPKPGEAPTGYKQGTPGELNPLATPAGAAGSSKAWNTIAIILSVLSVLSFLARFIPQIAPQLGALLPR